MYNVSNTFNYQKNLKQKFEVPHSPKIFAYRRPAYLCPDFEFQRHRQFEVFFRPSYSYISMLRSFRRYRYGECFWWYFQSNC